MSVNIWSNGKLVPIASSGTYVYNTPLGSIIAFSGNNIPVGFLLCDGRALNKNEYLDLFNVIGYTYGGSDNEFKLPDLRGKFAQGADGNLGEVIEAGLPNIKGNFDRSERNGRGPVNGAFFISDYVGGFARDYANDSNLVGFDASKGETKTDGTLKTADEHHVYGASNTVQPPAVAINYIIKATDYKDVPQSALDDSATTTGNVWSAAKVKEEIDNKNNYSTEETVIGKWIDGKPIYRKVIVSTFGLSPSSIKTLTLSNFGVNNVETPISSTIISNDGGYLGIRSNNIVTSFKTTVVDVVVISSQWSLGSGEQKIILEYTKTTD